ncbi:MAG: hypothetical protein WAN23_14060 [Candidatus Acidiferrales bacterium]
MRSLHRISLVLLAVPLLAILWSSLWMITFVQLERLQLVDHPGVLFSDAQIVHDGGFATLTAALMGLLILFIPYRKGERWAFGALAVLMVCYLLPVFVFVNFPRHLAWLFPLLPQSHRLSGVATIELYNYLTATLALAGLALALPQFLANRKKTQLRSP